MLLYAVAVDAHRRGRMHDGGESEASPSAWCATSGRSVNRLSIGVQSFDDDVLRSAVRIPPLTPPCHRAARTSSKRERRSHVRHPGQARRLRASVRGPCASARRTMTCTADHRATPFDALRRGAGGRAGGARRRRGGRAHADRRARAGFGGLRALRGGQLRPPRLCTCRHNIVLDRRALPGPGPFGCHDDAERAASHAGEGRPGRPTTSTRARWSPRISCWACA